MSLSGLPGDRSLLHDIIESLIHQIDKLALQGRKQYEWVLLPKDRQFSFENKFPALEKKGVYLVAPQIGAQRGPLKPEPWDEEGTLASFSAGSEAANVRKHLRGLEGRQRRGRKRDDGSVRALPEPMPEGMRRDFKAAVPLQEVSSVDYLERMILERGESPCYHRWAPVPKGGQGYYWKKTPVTTRTVDGDDVAAGALLESVVEAMRLNERGDQEGLKGLLEEVRQEPSKTKVEAGSSDLRRYTVNSHPALARAMALMLEQGEPVEKVRELMVKLTPAMVAEFERVTGRRVVGVSLHFDSDLPHWNFWHVGLEKVIYRVGEDEKERYRRTAMNLNSSGNMLAWDRVSRSFDRQGKDFAALSPATARELKKIEDRCMARQGRPPGDFSLNRKADELLELAMVKMGFEEVVERGFSEFVANEERRYQAGVAGREVNDTKGLERVLQPAPEESLYSAAKRLRKERDDLDAQTGKIMSVMAPAPGETLLSAVERAAKQAAAADSAAALAEKNQREMDGLRSDLDRSRRKIAALETEIGPLRKLKKIVETFLKLLMESPVVHKLSGKLTTMLQEIGDLLGIKFASGKNDDQEMPPK